VTRPAKATATAARACEGKQRHDSRKAALVHLSRLVKAGSSPAVLNVYVCPTRRFAEPRHWHVGHRPGATRSR